MSEKKKHKVIEKTEDGIQINLMKHQRAALNSKKQIAGIVGSRACGKTIYMSVEAFLEIVKGGRVLVLAQNYKSLKLNIFREIQNRFYEAGLKPEVNTSEMSIRFGNGELYGFTYEAIDSTRGLTEISLLLLDELAYAPVNLLSTVTPCLRGTEHGSRMRFGTSPKKGSIWNKWFKDPTVDKDMFTATMFENTELSEEDIELQKKAIKDEAQYQQEVLGVILDDDVQFGIIRVADYPTVRKAPCGQRRLGIDCAGSGADYNVFVVVDGSGILEKVKIQNADTFALFNTADRLIRDYEVKTVNIDCTGGFGNGLKDLLMMNRPGLLVYGINFGQKPKDETYLNARAEMYFNLASKIRDDGFFVDDVDVREELQYTTYEINAAGRTYIVPKQSIKELIDRSPDTADALALALYDSAESVISPSEALGIAMRFATI